MNKIIKINKDAIDIISIFFIAVLASGCVTLSANLLTK